MGPNPLLDKSALPALSQREIYRLAAHYTLNDEQKRERSAEYGSYPPTNDESVTHGIWCKHMQPWHPGAGNRAAKMTKEEEQALLAEIKGVCESSR